MTADCTLAALLTDDNLEDHPDKIPAAPVLEAS